MSPIPLGILAAQGGVVPFIGALGYSGDDTGTDLAINPLGGFYCQVETKIVDNFNSSIAVVKMNNEGQIQWQRSLKGSAYEAFARTMAADSSGNAYSIQAAGVSGKSYARHYAKYDSNGAIQWKKYNNTEDGRYFSAGGAKTDSSGNLYIASSVGETLNSGVQNAHLLKLTSAGASSFSVTQNSGQDEDYWTDLALGSSADIYALGLTKVSNVFNFRLSKYNSSGTIQWQRALRIGSFNTFSSKIAVDSSDNAYLVGSYETANNASPRLGLSKYDSSGNHVWTRSLGGTATNGTAIAIDSENNVYVAGNTSDAGTAGEIVLAKYNSSGTIQWQRILGTNSGDSVRTIKIGTDGLLYLIGNSSVGFYGAEDALIAKLPLDGSKTGTYTLLGKTITYAASSLSATTPSVTATTTSYTTSTYSITLTDSSVLEYTPTLTFTQVNI